MFINSKSYFFYRCQYKVKCYSNCSVESLIITTPQLGVCRRKKEGEIKRGCLLWKEELTTVIPLEREIIRTQSRTNSGIRYINYVVNWGILIVNISFIIQTERKAIFGSLSIKLPIIWVPVVCHKRRRFDPCSQGTHSPKGETEYNQKGNSVIKKKGKLMFSKNEPPCGLSQSKYSTLSTNVYEQH